MAQVKSNTNLGVVAPHLTTTVRGLKCGYYSAVKAAQNDWVEISDFTKIVAAQAWLVNPGVPTASKGLRTNEAITLPVATPTGIKFTSAYASPVEMIVWGY
jgi:hypothetical protein